MTRGILRVYKLSAPLEKMFGKAEMSRPMATKEFWAYAKRHNLQDPKNGRVVLPNEEMREVFHVDRIAFKDVSRLLSDHLVAIPDDQKPST